MFGHLERDIVMVHGDDFVSTADVGDQRWLESMLEEKSEIPTDIIGHDGASMKQIKVLNRFITVKDCGYTYEPDARHAGMIVKEFGWQGAKTLSTPVSDMHHESEELLDREKFNKYQSLCARANFLVIVRIDLHFGAKECCRSMSRPMVRDWFKLKIHRTILDRLSEAGARGQVPGRARDADGLQRCKLGKQRVGQTEHRWRISHAPSKSWSKTQSLTGRISAECELYAVVKASAEAMGSQAVIRDMGESWSTVVYRDASEASGAIQCQGLGRRRHVDCTFVFVHGISVNPKVFKKAD